MANVTLSPYQILWLEFIPAKGIVTKHDQRLLGATRIIGKSPKTYRKPVGTREDGLAFIESLRRSNSTSIIHAVSSPRSSSAWRRNQKATLYIILKSK